MPAVDKQGPAKGEEMNQALAAVLRFTRQVDRRHCFALLSRRLPAGLDVSAAFNVDAEEASEAIDRFMNHTRAVGKGVQGLRNIFGKVREARVGELFLLQSYSAFLTPVALGRDVEG